MRSRYHNLQKLFWWISRSLIQSACLRTRKLAHNKLAKANSNTPIMQKMYYKDIFELREDGDYTFTVPALPGCISEGNTDDDALAKIKEAIILYLESSQDD